MTARRYQHTRAKTPTQTRGADWRESARCVGSEHIYDLAADHPNDEGIVRAALTICADCPVAEICGRELIDLEHGVVGGLTEYQRRDIRRTARKPKAAEPTELECPSCAEMLPSKRGLSHHWGQKHSIETGTCIYGHKQPPGKRCPQCNRDAAMRAYYERKKKDGVA